jgi:hypothetical protein
MQNSESFVIKLDCCNRSRKRFKVLMVVNMLMVVFWVMMLPGLVGGYQHFEGTYCPSVQGSMFL